MRARIAGLGAFLPEHVRDNTAWPPEFIEQSRRRLGDRTLVDVPVDESDPHQRVAALHLAREAADPFLGTTRRRVAPSELTSAEAEALAARAALSDAGVDAADVDAILSWALVPDRMSPTNGSRVAALLGATRAWATSVDTACATAITQLDLAAGLIESGRARTVLLTQSHLVCRTMPMMHPASPNVGDAATAVVVTASERPGILSSFAATEGRYYDAVTWCRGKTPETDPPWWEAGGPMYIGSLSTADAQQLMQQTVRYGVETLRAVVERAHLTVDDIDVLCAVQPRRWVPGAIAEGLGLGADAAPQTFDELSHLGAVGVVMNLIAAREQGLLAPGSLAALYGQGAGFTRAAGLVRWVDTA